MTGRRLELAGAALAAAWLVGFVSIDVAVRTDAFFSIFFAVSPLIACAVLSPWWTAAYAALATVLAVTSGSWNDTYGSMQHYLRISDVAVVSAAAVFIAAVRVRRERRLARILAIAEAAQRAVLPTLPSRIHSLRIAVRYASATEEALVGGDLYDLHYSNSTVRVLIGDVRGKGLDGVQHAARVIRAFRQSAGACPDLEGVAKAMQDYLVPFFGDEDFVTAVLVEVSTPLGREGSLTLVDCGHPPPLLVADGRVTPVEGLRGMPLGLATSFSAVDAPWRPQDRLLLYTDGLIEARDACGRFLPPETIAECLRLPDPDTALNTLVVAVNEHVAGERTDDLALVLLDNVADVPATEEPKGLAADASPPVAAMLTDAR